MNNEKENLLVKCDEYREGNAKRIMMMPQSLAEYKEVKSEDWDLI